MTAADWSRRLLGLGEVPDPAQQDALHRVGDREVAGQAAAILDGQRELLEEERIALRAAQDHLGDRVGQRQPRASTERVTVRLSSFDSGGSESWVANDRLAQGGS